MTLEQLRPASTLSLFIPTSDLYCIPKIHQPSNPEDTEVETSRQLLRTVLKTVDAPPVEISPAFIHHCTDNFDRKHWKGEGAFGVVYRGFDASLDCAFAVKRVKAERMTPEELEQVQRTLRVEIAVSV